MFKLDKFKERRRHHCSVWRSQKESIKLVQWFWSEIVPDTSLAAVWLTAPTWNKRLHSAIRQCDRVLYYLLHTCTSCRPARAWCCDGVTSGRCDRRSGGILLEKYSSNWAKYSNPARIQNFQKIYKIKMWTLVFWMYSEYNYTTNAYWEKKLSFVCRLARWGHWSQIKSNRLRRIFRNSRHRNKRKLTPCTNKMKTYRLRANQH